MSGFLETRASRTEYCCWRHWRRARAEYVARSPPWMPARQPGSFDSSAQRYLVSAPAGGGRLMVTPGSVGRIESSTAAARELPPACPWDFLLAAISPPL